MRSFSSSVSIVGMAWDKRGAIKNESCATGGIHKHRVRTASGSDRILRATRHKHLFRKLLFDPVASTTPSGLPARGPRSARGSDTNRGDFSHSNYTRPISIENLRLGLRMITLLSMKI